jgi:hypothetical protein
LNEIEKTVDQIADIAGLTVSFGKTIKGDLSTK